VISTRAYFDSDGNLQSGSYYFIFNNINQAWYFHRSFGNTTHVIRDAVEYNNKIVTLSYGNNNAMVYEKEGSTGFMDRLAEDTGDIGYDFNITFAPVSNGRAFVQKCAGIDVILETDLSAAINYQLIKNFGASTTTAQKVTVGSGLQKAYVNMGHEGSYIQPKISGTTITGKTVGLDLYGINFWSEQGASPR
jgi:hypothetical protein